jgi:hypothetical protein
MECEMKDTHVEYFAYLDDLRASGVTNMFGARPYVEEEFGLSKAEATKVLTAGCGPSAGTRPRSSVWSHEDQKTT